MSLDRADIVIKSFQTENPRLYEALSQLSTEVRRIFVNDVIKNILLDVDYIFNNVGLKYDDRFKASYSTDREQGTFNIGGRVGAVPNAVLQVDGNQEDTGKDQEVLTIGRKNLSSAQPLTNFGADLAFRLQGFTIGSEPEAGRVQVVWGADQTNNTTQRDSILSLWSMTDNVLTKRLIVNKDGSVVIGDGTSLNDNATDGFLEIPSTNGIPTGTPVLTGSAIPIDIDRTNYDLYAYINGAWRNIGFGLTTSEIDVTLNALGPAYSGTFDITGLSGLVTGKPVLVFQAAGPYTGKGDREDEAEMDLVTATGYVLNATIIRVYWTTPVSNGPISGNIKFNYIVA